VRELVLVRDKQDNKIQMHFQDLEGHATVALPLVACPHAESILLHVCFLPKGEATCSQSLESKSRKIVCKIRVSTSSMHWKSQQQKNDKYG